MTIPRPPAKATADGLPERLPAGPHEPKKKKPNNYSLTFRLNRAATSLAQALDPHHAYRMPSPVRLPWASLPSVINF